MPDRPLGGLARQCWAEVGGQLLDGRNDHLRLGSRHPARPHAVRHARPPFQGLGQAQLGTGGHGVGLGDVGQPSRHVPSAVGVGDVIARSQDPGLEFGDLGLDPTELDQRSLLLRDRHEHRLRVCQPGQRAAHLGRGAHDRMRRNQSGDRHDRPPSSSADPGTFNGSSRLVGRHL
ncbi:hypothetical protein [Nocardioides humi]|uniref:Uncharacterized protein n=1 Tax=Nocardioides humi TaxID=449461 RepID=A0ABN2B8C3_9ACTN|nr:hypothetical protein [Nocardioides humi]